MPGNISCRLGRMVLSEFGLAITIVSPPTGPAMTLPRGSMIGLWPVCCP